MSKLVFILENYYKNCLSKDGFVKQYQKKTKYDIKKIIAIAEELTNQGWSVKAILTRLNVPHNIYYENVPDHIRKKAAQNYKNQIKLKKASKTK